MASYDPQDDDAFLDRDIAPPNLKAQYRGYRAVRLLILGAGLLALVFAAIDGANAVLAAFPSSSSLLDQAAWVKLSAGFGTLAKVGLVVAVALLVWRWRARRSASRKRKLSAG